MTDDKDTTLSDFRNYYEDKSKEDRKISLSERQLDELEKIRQYIQSADMSSSNDNAVKSIDTSSIMKNQNGLYEYVNSIPDLNSQETNTPISTISTQNTEAVKPFVSNEILASDQNTQNIKTIDVSDIKSAENINKITQDISAIDVPISTISIQNTEAVKPFVSNEILTSDQGTQNIKTIDISDIKSTENIKKVTQDIDAIDIPISTISIQDTETVKPSVFNAAPESDQNIQNIKTIDVSDVKSAENIEEVAQDVDAIDIPITTTSVQNTETAKPSVFNTIPELDQDTPNIKTIDASVSSFPEQNTDVINDYIANNSEDPNVTTPISNLNSQNINNGNSSYYYAGTQVAVPMLALNNQNMNNFNSPSLTPSVFNNVSTSDLAMLGGMVLQNSNQPDIKNKISNFMNSTFMKANMVDYTRTSSKSIEGLQQAQIQGFQRAGLNVAEFGGNLAGGSLGASLGAVAGSALIPIPGVGTMIGTMAGYAAGSFLGGKGVGLVTDQYRDRMSYDNWLQQNSDRFINAFESSNGRTGAGFNKEERKEMAKYLANINTEFLMSDDEIYTLLDGVTDVGLLTSTSDMESFKKKFSSLVSAVKSGAKMLNTSYEEMVQMLGDLNKEGIRSPEQQQEAQAGIKAISQITGKDSVTSAQLIQDTRDAFYNNASLDATTAQNLSESKIATMEAAKVVIDKSDFPTNVEGGQLLQNYFNNQLNRDSSQLGLATSSWMGKIVSSDVSSSLLAYMGRTDDYTKTFSFDKNVVSNVQSMIDKGATIDDVRNYLLNNPLQLDEKTITNNINRFKDQSPTDTLANLNNTLGETGTNDFLLSLVQSGVNKTGGYDEILARSTFGGLTEDEYNMLKAYNQVLQDPNVANTMQQQQALESQNVMRNKVEEAMGGPPIDRLKAKVESFFQGTADVTETTFKSTGIGDFTTRILGNVTDYFAGKDTAFNNGYNNQAAVDYSSDNQDDVYKELFIKDNLYALDKNESKRLKDQIGSKQEDLKGVMYGSDMRNKTTLTLANTTSSKFAQFFGDDGGLSTKTLLKDIDKRDDLTEEEKEKLKSDINKSQAQTQNVVSATLDTATLIGGGELRSVLKDNVDLVGYGALTKLDDLSDINKISSLSLTEQRKIQQVLPEYLTKTLVTNYSESALNQKLTEAMVNNGFGENSELYQKVMADNKISEDEVKDIVTSIMNQTQQYSGTTITTDDGTQQVADSSSKNAKLMGEVANNSKKQTEALEKIIEEQNKQIDSMEKKLAKIGVR